MDPRIAWFQSEKIGKAHTQWIRIVEATNLNSEPNIFFDRNMPNITNGDSRAPDYISLDNGDDNEKRNETYANQNGVGHGVRKRKRENKASTYGINNSSNLALIESGCLTPWRSRVTYYSPGIIG